VTPVHQPTAIIEQHLDLPLHANAIGDVLLQHLPVIGAACWEKNPSTGK